jgi:hypothetical protein
MVASDWARISWIFAAVAAATTLLMGRETQPD